MNNDKINKETFKELGAYIGETVKTVRRACGKSKADLAVLLRNEYDWITTIDLMVQIESGERKLSFEEFLDICDALGLSAEEMLACAKLAKQESQNFQ